MEVFLGIVGSAIIAFLTAQWTAARERERIREELKLEYALETALRQLLEDRAFVMRSFEKIKHHIRGFSDDELRRHLVRAGAIAFESREHGEVWGLLGRNREALRQASETGETQ